MKKSEKCPQRLPAEGCFAWRTASHLDTSSCGCDVLQFPPCSPNDHLSPETFMLILVGTNLVSCNGTSITKARNSHHAKLQLHLAIIATATTGSFTCITP